MDYPLTQVQKNRMSEQLLDDLKAEKASGTFLTRQRHLDMGMCCCDACGKLCSTDYKWCWKCERNVVIFEANLMRKQQRRVARELKEKNNQTHEPLT